MPYAHVYLLTQRGVVHSARRATFFLYHPRQLTQVVQTPPSVNTCQNVVLIAARRGFTLEDTRWEGRACIWAKRVVRGSIYQEVKLINCWLIAFVTRHQSRQSVIQDEGPICAICIVEP